MIKFTSELPDDRHLLGLMLTEENLTRLKDGRPIHVFMEQLGGRLPWKGEILIGYGNTADNIMATLKDLIGVETVVRQDPGSGSFQ